MKKRYLSLVPIAALMVSPLSAATLQPTLEKVAAKVDTDGDFLQLNKFDGDLATLKEYGELLLDIARAENSEIPAAFNLLKMFDLLGLDDMKASASSSKKVDGSWNNRAYLWTGGSQKGILSLYGKANEKYEVATFAPESADIVLQLRLNLSQMNKVITEMGDAMGQGDMMRKEFGKPQEEIGGMTPFQLIEKLNFRVNIAIDIDRKNRLVMEGADAPGAELVARIDNVAWAWDIFGEQLIKDSGMPWDKKLEGQVTTYTLSEEAAKELMGYRPVICIDKAKNYIWIASKPTVLAAARGDGPKLKDGAAFKKTMATLPQNGNSLAYVSKDLLDELVSQYKMAGKNGLLVDPQFEMAKPLVDKLIADLTGGESGMAAVISVDEQGINSVLRAPFPLKNYLDKLTPLVGMLGAYGTANRVMEAPRLR